MANNVYKFQVIAREDLDVISISFNNTLFEVIVARHTFNIAIVQPFDGF
jgi:hypothetical protein